MAQVPESNLPARSGAVLRELLRSPAGSIHMLGICGIGMAGLARLLHDRGWQVTGCDAAPNRLADWLAGFGIRVFTGHDPSHISTDVRWLVRSAAVRPDCAELVRATEAGLPVFSRGEVLAALLASTRAVVVAGTHGKTTTTTWITLLLRACGRQPGWCIGGESDPLGSVAMDAPPDHFFVAEGDESDGTLSLYQSEIAVVTNIDLDHLDHFSGPAALEECFLRFAQNARRRVVFCADDPRAYRLLAELPKGLSYGLSKEAAIKGTDLVETESSTSFTILERDHVVIRVNLPVPGRHNVLNALAAAAVGLELGLSAEELRGGLEKVVLPRRRLERVAECGGVTVFSDYGHHPTEITAVMRTLQRLPHSRLLAVFQPHRFTRTLHLRQDFPLAFEGIEQLLLTPVYAASESPVKGGSVWDLYAQFRRSGVPRDVRLATSLQQAWAYLRRELREGDVLLVLGAGNVEQIATLVQEAAQLSTGGPRPFDALPERMVGELQERLSVTRLKRDFPLARQTTLGVGGTADWWAEPGSLGDLVTILGWASSAGVPVNVIGAGSNTLVSDLGVRGIVLRLSSPCFRRSREENGDVVAGAGWPLGPLLDRLEEDGRSGLEFLEGIPATLGGALRMNAGAWGEEIARYVAWVRCLDMDGTACTLYTSDLDAQYRSCRALEGRIVLEAALKLGRDKPAVIRLRRRRFADQRRWMRGLRCAGSVFKNPETAPAGRLIEQAGLKGMRVGGARVFEGHANVIVTESEASASDVRALLELVRIEVQDQTGVRLEPEIVFFE